MGHTHTESRGIDQGYFGRGDGKEKGKGRSRLKYFDQTILDMECETFREVKQLAGDRAEWRRVVASNQSKDCVLNDDDDVNSTPTNGVYYTLLQLR